MEREGKPRVLQGLGPDGCSVPLSNMHFLSTCSVHSMGEGWRGRRGGEKAFVVKEKTGRPGSWRAWDTTLRSWGCFFKTGAYPNVLHAHEFPL